MGGFLPTHENFQSSSSSFVIISQTFDFHAWVDVDPFRRTWSLRTTLAPFHTLGSTGPPPKSPCLPSEAGAGLTYFSRRQKSLNNDFDPFLRREGGRRGFGGCTVGGWYVRPFLSVCLFIYLSTYPSIHPCRRSHRFWSTVLPCPVLQVCSSTPQSETQETTFANAAIRYCVSPPAPSPPRLRPPVPIPWVVSYLIRSHCSSPSRTNDRFPEKSSPLPPSPLLP